MNSILGLQFAAAEKYSDVLKAVVTLEKAAGMNIESLTALFLRGYTLKEPQEVTFEELEKSINKSLNKNMYFKHKRIVENNR